MNIESCDIVYASDHEEFYYKDSGLAVEEGEPVGRFGWSRRQLGRG